MNPHILIVIDNQLNPDKYTLGQLEQNAAEAAAYAAAYDDVDTYAHYVYDAAYDAYADVDDDYWLDRYFKNSGENKQDYIDESNKDKK